MTGIKLAGLLLTSTFVTGLGFYSAGRLHQRVICLRTLAHFLEALGVALSVRLEAPGEAIGGLLRQPAYKSLSFLQKCADDCADGIPFPLAWSSVTERPAPGLSQEETAWLYSLGSVLGQSALPMQMAVLEQVCMQFRSAYAAAGEQAAVQSRVYKTVGLLGGALVAIVLL